MGGLPRVCSLRDSAPIRSAVRTLAFVPREERRLEVLARTANEAHRTTIRNALVAGQALLEAKEIVGHGGWRKWVADNCCFSYRTARVYMQLARNPKSAGSADSLMAALEAVRTPGRYSFVSGDEDWYTPRAIVDAARRVLGRIDLDPASCDAANAVVRARRIYTIKDDGLKQPWRGRVFMNPPYSITKISLFIERLVEHVKAGKVTAAVVVVNSETEVRWFHALAAISAGVCFPRGRVKFWKAGTRTTGGAPLGTALVYIGKRPKQFGRAFRKFGHVWFA